MHIRNEIRASAQLVLWTFAWVASLALAKFGPQFLWDPSRQAASWTAVALNVAAGACWIIAFTRFLRALDELQRKIMLEALAITLGVGWVTGLAYVVADTAGLVARDVDVAALPAFTGVVFVVAFAVGKIRYR
ncbi:hypothetical protein AB0F72_37655 [Actinoplanes sp. NPDC023936]|uniref:hypothetical protein n=1 Tax=Actinoplanes sp. NPDC023936 TaxID=3154910 RepID=UPI0033E745E3